MTAIIVVYLAKLGVGKVLTNPKSVANRSNYYYYFSMVILIVFLGSRVGVGTDYFSYKNHFYFPQSHIYSFGTSFELGHIVLVYVLKSFNLEYQWYIFTTSFITIVLLYRVFSKSLYLLPLSLFFFFFADYYNFMINGVRQGVAIAAFLNALKYVGWDSNYKSFFSNLMRYLAFICIGFLFHYTIIFLIPLFFIMNKKVLSLVNSKHLLIVFVMLFFVKQISFDYYLLEHIEQYIPNYSSYINKYLEFTGVSINFGIASTMLVLATIIPIYLFDKIKSKFPELTVYFILFTIGTSMTTIYINENIIRRVFLYFSLSNIVVYPALYYYLKSIVYKNNYIILIHYFICGVFIMKTLYYLPHFMNVQILFDEYSLWFLPLEK